MSLYQLSLLSVLQQLINADISLDDVNNCPEDILKEINIYTKSHNITNCLYISLNLGHYGLSKIFLNKIPITDREYILNYGLRLAKNKDIADWLIANGANKFNVGIIGAQLRHDEIMLKYFENLI